MLVTRHNDRFAAATPCPKRADHRTRIGAPQEPARDHFSTDAAARKRNVLWGGVGWASRIGWNVAVGKFIEV